MTRAEALEKVRKLLALAQSDNEHEAALAAAAADRLLTKYELDRAELDAPEDDAEECQEWEHPLYTFNKKRPTWKGVLAAGISRHFGCFVYRTHKYGEGRCVLIGRASNVAAARYIFEWVSQEIDRLASKQKGNGRSWVSAYRHGAASAVLDALKKEREAASREARTAATGSALVAIDKALALRNERALEARQWAAQHVPGISRGTTTTITSTGYYAGLRDGAGIYGARRPQLGAGQGRIKG